MPITSKVWNTGSRQSCTTGKQSFTAESNAVLWAVFQCQVEPCFCLGSYRRSRNLTECMCVQMSHVWASETAPPFPPLSRCTVARLPGEIEPSGLNSYIPVSQPDSTAFPCTGALTSCMPEAVALVPIDGFQTVGFPMSVAFLLKPKSSDLVSREGERED